MAFAFKHGDRPLEGYTIQRAIGRGGFGEVYYAMSDGGREVALKYLKENPAVELRGVSHCINLKSPHLVSIFDVKKSADGDYFIIMEYCSGPSLRDLMIAEPKGFPPDKAAFFTREIAKGLSYLHDRGIVHRDLKPGNIFFDDGYVKIGDYGLSKFISVSRHSVQTSSVGTVHYMAPEIGSGNYSRGVDIYALGVMLYEMLLGKVPFEGSTMAEVLMKHLTTQPELDELHGPFGKVIRKALEKDPKDRYQTAEEMLDDLLSGEEIQRSLAGFSTKSLEGAVRTGGRDRLDSPMPSPNPSPRGFGADLGRGAGRDGGGLVEGVELSDRLARRFDRISRKLDRKIAKLAGRRGRSGPVGAPPEDANEIPWAQPALPRGERGKRFVLLFMLLAGLSVALGLIVGNSAGMFAGEKGAAAGMLAAALYLGVLIGGRAVRWFGVESGPGWANKLIRGSSAAPLMAVGCAPIFDAGIGLPVWLGLIALAAINNWESDSETGDRGEIRFGPIFGNAVFALILTAIAGVITGDERHPQRVMFISAGAAAVATFVLQAGAWWNVRHRLAGALGPIPAPPMGPGGRPTIDSGQGPEGAAGQPTVAQELSNRKDALAEPTAAQALPDPFAPRARSMFLRMFWSLAAFAFMGGAIVTLLIPLVSRNLAYHDVTQAIVMCTGFAALMFFSLCKATPHKRWGFWRESLRPLLISASLFGIGGTTTGIAREWSHEDLPCELSDWKTRFLEINHEALRVETRAKVIEVLNSIPGTHRIPPPPPVSRTPKAPRPPRPAVATVGTGDTVVGDAAFLDDSDFADLPAADERPCLEDGDRVALIAGLVMSSIMFLGLTFFTGGKPRAPRAPKSFLRGGEKGQRSIEEPGALRGPEEASNCAVANCDNCEPLVIPIVLATRRS